MRKYVHVCFAFSPILHQSVGTNEPIRKLTNPQTATIIRNHDDATFSHSRLPVFVKLHQGLVWSGLLNANSPVRDRSCYVR